MSPPAAIASMNALVPDFAMVPRLLISSFLVMPMPESSMVKVEFVLSGMILMKKLGWACKTTTTLMHCKTTTTLLHWACKMHDFYKFGVHGSIGLLTSWTTPLAHREIPPMRRFRILPYDVKSKHSAHLSHLLQANPSIAVSRTQTVTAWFFEKRYGPKPHETKWRNIAVTPATPLKHLSLHCFIFCIANNSCSKNRAKMRVTIPIQPTHK